VLDTGQIFSALHTAKHEEHDLWEKIHRHACFSWKNRHHVVLERRSIGGSFPAVWRQGPVVNILASDTEEALCERFLCWLRTRGRMLLDQVDHE